MQKIYSLLRNNQQTGPYTLDALLQHSLKPFDLIWVEGKSAGWSYPSEIAALKPFVSQDVTIKQKETSLAEITEPDSINVATPINETPASGKAVTAKHIYISLPAGAHFGKTIAPVHTHEEESPEAKLERKAEELRNKIQAFAEGKSSSPADNELDIKYSRSLNDIKEEYSDWLHQQKKKTTLQGFKKPFLIVASLCIVSISGYFFKANKLVATQGNDKIAVASNSLPVLFKEKDEEHSRDITHKSKKAAIIRKQSKTITFPAKPVAITSSSPTKTNRIDVFIDSIKNLEQNRKKEDDQEFSTTEEIKPNTTERTAVTKKPVSERENKPAKESSVSLANLIELSESIDREGAELTVYNNSNQHLKFVAVDVFYYKSNNKLLQKKTIYFNDILPKSFSKQAVSEEKKAASMQFALGLISAESGLYYAKQ